MATNYERGRAFEYRVRDKLYEMGARKVFRSAGSKQEADLVALFARDHGAGRFKSEVWLVQAKRDGKLPPGEREALLQLSLDTDTKPYLAATGPKGRGVVLSRLGDVETTQATTEEGRRDGGLFR